MTPRSERRIVATYDYRDAAGDLMFQVVRFEPKDFRQRRPVGRAGWVWSLEGVELVLYRLPERVHSEPTRAVLLVEGEKDADRLAALDLVATTGPGGASKWRSEFGFVLADRDVVVVPDNDEAGRRHVERVCSMLHGIARSLRVLELPGLPPKGDVSNWLDAGGTREQLLESARQTSFWEPSAAANCSRSSNRSVVSLPPQLRPSWDRERVLEEIRARTDLLALFNARAAYRSPTKILCPWHEDRLPSLAIWPERGRWWCFGCGAGGDVVSAYMRLHELSFRDAVQELGRSIGLELGTRTPAGRGIRRACLAK